MAQARRRKAGERVGAQLRRIGHKHAIWVPAHEVQVLDMAKVDQAILNATRRLAQLEEERQKVQAVLEDLRDQRAAFDAQTIDRDDDDPDVPQPEPPAPPPRVVDPEPAG